jgi:hypothetical protein
MDFELTQDQQIFYDSVKRFAVNELGDGAVDRANSDGYLWDVAARFAEMGIAWESPFLNPRAVLAEA